MTPLQKEYVYGCIARIHHLWLEEHVPGDEVVKITALFEALNAIMPNAFHEHTHYLWLAYRNAFDDRLWHLSRYRYRLFNDAFDTMWKAAQVLPH